MHHIGALVIKKIGAVAPKPATFFRNIKIMESRKLEHLSTPMLAACVEFELQLKLNKINFVRACTFRSIDAQEKLYAQGRTTPGKIITWQKGGESKHNRVKNGLPAADAADYYPLLYGKLADDTSVIGLALWLQVGQIGETCGLQWGGRWRKPKTDKPHFQLRE